MLVQSVKTGKIYDLMQSVAERQLKSSQFIRVDSASAERIVGSVVVNSKTSWRYDQQN